MSGTRDMGIWQLLAATICMLILARMPAAIAGELSSSALSALIAGNIWVSEDADGTPFWINWDADGSFCLKSNSNAAGQPCELEGTWRMERAKYCMRPSSGDWEQCLRVSDEGGGNFNSLLDDGSVDFTWSVEE